MSKPSVKKSGPTTHSSRPRVHATGDIIEYVMIRRLRGHSEKARRSLEIVVRMQERAREKRDRRAERLSLLHFHAQSDGSRSVPSEGTDS